MPTIQIEKMFHQPVEKVFNAWLDPVNISQWLLSTDKEILSVVISARVGGNFCFSVNRNKQKIDHLGVYLKIDKPRNLSFTWEVPFYSKESSTVSIAFEEQGSNTKLSLTHEKVLKESAESAKTSWVRILNALDAYLKMNYEIKAD